MVHIYYTCSVALRSSYTGSSKALSTTGDTSNSVQQEAGVRPQMVLLCTWSVALTSYYNGSRMVLKLLAGDTSHDFQHYADGRPQMVHLCA